MASMAGEVIGTVGGHEIRVKGLRLGNPTVDEDGKTIWNMEMELEYPPALTALIAAPPPPNPDSP